MQKVCVWGGGGTCPPLRLLCNLQVGDDRISISVLKGVACELT